MLRPVWVGGGAPLPAQQRGLGGQRADDHRAPGDAGISTAGRPAEEGIALEGVDNERKGVIHGWLGRKGGIVCVAHTHRMCVISAEHNTGSSISITKREREHENSIDRNGVHSSLSSSSSFKTRASYHYRAVGKHREASKMGTRGTRGRRLCFYFYPLLFLNLTYYYYHVAGVLGLGPWAIEVALDILWRMCFLFWIDGYHHRYES